MNISTSKPIETLRDGAIKAAIWSNLGEKGNFYSVQINRTTRTTRATTIPAASAVLSFSEWLA